MTPYFVLVASALVVVALVLIAAMIARDGGVEEDGWEAGHLDELDAMLDGDDTLAYVITDAPPARLAIEAGAYVGHHRTVRDVPDWYLPLYRREFAQWLTGIERRWMVQL